MYYPILRGKLNELLAIRELSELGLKNFIPVIEPVKNDIKALCKTIEVLNKNGIVPYIIINPIIGDFKKSQTEFSELITKIENIEYIPLYSINEKTNLYNDFLELNNFGLFIQKGIDKELIDFTKISRINFIQNDNSPQVKRLIHNKVVYEDFFKRQLRNADYPQESSFSALHSYYHEENNIGFGDYTITGDDFIEGGGPAYVVTFHASYIDSQRFDELFIRHYSSEDDGTPTNPGAKFKEALTKLISDFQSKKILFEETKGLQEFIFLYKIGHFPGLGQVKKNSIMHHIETINIYLESKD